MSDDEKQRDISVLADKLMNDLSFAAPEMWRLHILRRFAEVIDVVQEDEDD